jgi:hypothetical protein
LIGRRRTKVVRAKAPGSPISGWQNEALDQDQEPQSSGNGSGHENPNNEGFEMRGILVICVVLVLSVAANAKGYAFRGFGASSCRTYADAMRKDPAVEEFYLSWALGFMSGWNSLTSVVGKGTYKDLSAKDGDAMKYFLRRYCEEHPLSDYNTGVLELLKTLPTQDSREIIPPQRQ